MQKDFHFYTIYVLCRCNGMSPEHARIVAYASQHTDDAKYEHALEFENGGRFQQVLSAHKFLHLEVLSLDSQHKIYVPFHFLPGIEGNRFQEHMVCRQNSTIAQEMIREVARLKDKPYMLHRFGIALHVYADTWSHQEFSGLQTELNDVEEIDVVNEDKKGIAKIFMDFFRSIAESAIPQIGHAEATTLPDEPFREWNFKHVYQDRIIYRKNWEFCLGACKAIYAEIKHFLSATNNAEYKAEPTISWGNIRSELNTLFKQKGDLEERCNNWVQRINESGFGFDCYPEEQNLSYDDREWFRAAVEVRAIDKGEDIYGSEEEGVDIYVRKEDFHTSNWKYFHDAAASHRFFVLQELLAREGIICG